MDDQLQEPFCGGEHQQQIGLGLRVGYVEHLSPKSSDCIPRSSSDDEGGVPARGLDAGGGAAPPQWTDSRRSFPLRHKCFKGAALVLFAGLALAGCGGGGESADTTTESASSSSSLDDAGQNACYRFLTFTQEATTLNGEELHSAVKRIYDDAKDTSNATIRDGARLMLEREVAGDVSGMAAAGNTVGDECVRLAPG